MHFKVHDDAQNAKERILMVIDTHKTSTSLTRVKQMLALGHCMDVADGLVDYLCSKHECGWFDGGCFTLAVAVSSVIKGAEVYHVSRSAQHCDHVVVKLSLVGDTAIYFDGDGMQTKEKLLTKMQEQELTPCTVLEPLTDIDPSLIFQDVVDEFILRFNRINYTEGL